MSPRLQATDLTLTYDKRPIITGLNLQLPNGQISVLVGPNGCGKSTLLKGLARILRPKQGMVYLDGREIQALPTRDIAQQMGILPQGPTPPEGLTVKDLVAQGRYPHQSWWQQWSVQDEQMTRQALDITHLTEMADRSLDQLSGGQRQRAWIAMALAQDTPILLLDEPTTFLDLAHQMEVLELLWALNRDQGRTIIMVLHDLNQACRFAHHLVALRDGQVVAQGSPQQVVQEEMVRQVFGWRCRILPDPVTGTPLCIPLPSTHQLP